MRNKSDKSLENVLILQGGGSLGAFACGVYKALVKNNVNLDIVAGTSIGGVNASIIAGSRKKDNTDQLLEDFWLELSENYIDLDKISYSSYFTKNFEPLFKYFFNLFPTNHKDHQIAKENNYIDTNMRQLKSFYSSAIFGNDSMFKPRWSPEFMWTDPDYLSPTKWTYLYDHTPLIRTLERYIDYKNLNPNSYGDTRLILTAVDVLTSRPLIFDSLKMQIESKHILATSAYPLYNFPWVEVEEGIFAWDGGLLSNTPLREVLEASPVNDKRIFLVENYPKKVNHLPTSLPEVRHRARDIIFSDKTEHSIKMSKVVTMYLDYIDELYQIINDNIDKISLDESRLKKIKRKYKKYKQDHGAEIKELFYITREENNPHIFENADFSPHAIKQSIIEGEKEAEDTIRKHQVNN